jgi:biotin-dependent carboxylase-like uncharacterized protein
MSRDVRLTVASAGWVTTFQDLGRRDAERLGVPAGGAADQNSATIANILVGNGRNAAMIESMGGELSVIPSHDVLVAVTGTPAGVTVDGGRVEQWAPFVVPAGHLLSIHAAHSGSRSYVAVNGVIDAPRFLGSVAPDARMGFTQTITAGMEINVVSGFAGFRRTFFEQSFFRFPVPVPSFPEHAWTVDLVESSLTNSVPGLRTLVECSRYVVSPRSNHVGLRLDGPVLHPQGDTEIVSHGVPIGAIEIPHGDELIVLGRYRTLTAGYPIVGFASRMSQSMLGQVSPGRELAFRWIDRSAARRRLAEFENRLEALEDSVKHAFRAAGLGLEPAGAPMNVLPDAIDALPDRPINATIF